MERCFCASNLRQGGAGREGYKVEERFVRLKFPVIGCSYKPKLNTFFEETT